VNVKYAGISVREIVTELYRKDGRIRYPVLFRQNGSYRQYVGGKYEFTVRFPYLSPDQ
jgi:hypothetical protein